MLYKEVAKIVGITTLEHLCADPLVWNEVGSKIEQLHNQLLVDFNVKDIGDIDVDATVTPTAETMVEEIREAANKIAK